MSRVTHQPKFLNRRAIGKSEGAKGAHSLTNTTHNALFASRVVGKSSGCRRLLVQDGFWRELEELPQPRDRGLSVLLLQAFIIGALPPQLRVGKRRRDNRRLTLWSTAITRMAHRNK